MNQRMAEEQKEKLDRAISMARSDDWTLQDKGIAFLETCWYEKSVAIQTIADVYKKRYYSTYDEQYAKLAIQKYKELLARDDGFMFVQEALSALEADVKKEQEERNK